MAGVWHAWAFTVAPEERRKSWLVCGALGPSPIHSHSAGRPADLTIPDFVSQLSNDLEQRIVAGQL